MPCFWGVQASAHTRGRDTLPRLTAPAPAPDWRSGTAWPLFANVTCKAGDTKLAARRTPLCAWYHVAPLRRAARAVSPRMLLPPTCKQDAQTSFKPLSAVYELGSFAHYQGLAFPLHAAATTPEREFERAACALAAPVTGPCGRPRPAGRPPWAPGGAARRGPPTRAARPPSAWRRGPAPRSAAAHLLSGRARPGRWTAWRARARLLPALRRCCRRWRPHAAAPRGRQEGWQCSARPQARAGPRLANPWLLPARTGRGRGCLPEAPALLTRCQPRAFQRRGPPQAPARRPSPRQAAPRPARVRQRGHARATCARRCGRHPAGTPGWMARPGPPPGCLMCLPGPLPHAPTRARPTARNNTPACSLSACGRGIGFGACGQRAACRKPDPPVEHKSFTTRQADNRSWMAAGVLAGALCAPAAR